MKIVENRKIWISISIIIIIAGMISLGMNGLNLGIDFAGGTIITIDLHQTFEVSDIREITDTFDTDADITYAGDDMQQVVIQTQHTILDEQRDEIFSQFQEKYNLDPTDLLSVETVSPVIGGELQNQLLLATTIAAIAMLVYISFRFEVSFALAAIIGLIHDILILISFYTIMGIQVNSPFIVAILTVVGYSINDTIVLFDRIRENRRVIKKDDYSQLVNQSVRQSLNRSINTSLTTLITITALYVLGVEAIRNFALPLMVGFATGTYSSIFISGSVWYMIKTRKKGNTRVA